MSRKVNATYSSDQVKAAFRVFEATAPPGYVRSDTLVRALCTYGANIVKPLLYYLIRNRKTYRSSSEGTR